MTIFLGEKRKRERRNDYGEKENKRGMREKQKK